MSASKSIIMSAALLAVFVAPGYSRAQSATPSDAGDGAAATPAAPPVIVINKTPADQGIFTFNYGVPTSTALNLIGASADKIVTTTALSPFVIQLPSSFGAGQGQSGGIDLTPAWLMGPKTAQDYTDKANYVVRLGYRTHLTAAVSQGTSNSDPTKAVPSKLAFGASMSLLDFSDPLFAKFSGDNESVWKACTDPTTGEVIAAEKSVPPVGPEMLADQKKMDTASAMVKSLKEQKAKIEADRLEQRKLLSDSLASIAKSPKSDERDALEQKINKKIDDLGSFADLDQKIDEASKIERDAERAYSADVEKYSTTISKTWKDSAAEKAISGCVTQAGLAAAYAPDVEVGAGALWDGVPGRIGGFNGAGQVVWAAGHFPIGHVSLTQDKSDVTNHMQAGFSLRSSWNEVVSTGDKTHPMAPAELLDGWFGLQYLGANSSLSLQGGYQYRHTAITLPSFQQNRWRYLAAWTHEVSKGSGIWLSVSYGDTTDDTLRKDEQLLISFSFTKPKAMPSIFGIK